MTTPTVTIAGNSSPNEPTPSHKTRAFTLIEIMVVVAMEMKANSNTNPHDARKLEAVLEDVGAARGYLLCMATASQQLNPHVSNISLDLTPCWLP